MSNQLTPPEELRHLPMMRYWAERKPPKNRAEMFSAVRNTDGETDGGESGSVSTGTVATLRLYGPIDSWGGWWGISARDVSEALDSLGEGVSEIRVRINSPGGEVWEGMAILNMLRAHPAKVVAVVDGIAASAASVIATGCEETVMSPGTQLMVHDASGFAFGNEATMLKAAKFLASTSNAIASVYAESAGGTDAEWRAVMVEETWYTAQEAVDAKLADRVAVVSDAGSTSTAGDDESDIEVNVEVVENRFDLSIFNYAGRSNAPTPKPPTASAGGSSTTTQEGSPAVAFSDEQVTDMRQKLGLPEDADEATILAALDETLAEHADPTPTNIPEGHVVVPEARLTDLEAAAAQGVGAATQLRNSEREAFLDANRTKFAPANRAAWAKEYDRDPEGTRKHFETAPVIVPVDSLGHDGEPDTTESDQVYNSLFGDEKAGVSA